MRGRVHHLPIAANVDAAWQRYTGLVQAVDADPTLRLDRDHQQEIVRAWSAWRDAFLAADR